MKTRLPEHGPLERPRFWRTLDERAETLEAQQAAHDEFLPGAVPAGPGQNDVHGLPFQDGVTRRDFFGLVSAAAALAATVACDRKGQGTVVPYTKRPPEVVPGIANYYASAAQEGRRVYPVLVKTREGRPIHITGNDEHPGVKGKTSPRTMADVLRLYDPDRLRAPKADGRTTGWAQAEARLHGALKDAKAAGRPVLLISGAVASPTRKALLADLKAALPTLEYLAFEPAAGDAAEVAAQASYGQSVVIQPRLDRADVILSLGADFLSGEDPEAQAAWGARRRLKTAHDSINRLWVLEGPLTLTGTNADQRVPVAPSRLAAVAFALARELGGLPAGTDLSAIPAGAPKEIPAQVWSKLVRDLHRAGRRAVVLCGAHMPAEVHQAAHLLNALLGSEAVAAQPAEPLATVRELQAAVDGMAAGRYAAVVFWGGNPAFAFPRAAAWKDAVAKVPFRAWIGEVEDETAVQCQVLLAESHWLESWGDFDTPGAAVLQQPAIGTLYDTRQGEEILLGALKALGAAAPDTYHAYLQARWKRAVLGSGSFEQALHDGLVKTEAKAPLAFKGASVAAAAKKAAETKAAGLELVLFPGFATHDGRHANNSWLQETPDPITKMTWDNPVAVSVQDAKALGIQEGDWVSLSVEGTSLRLPAVIQPGQAQGVLALALGYGRGTGGVAKGVGVNAFPLMGLDPATANVRPGARLAKAGGRKELARTQSHHRMEGRDLVRSLTLDEFAHNPQGHHHMPELVTLYKEAGASAEHKWGMVIDLAACTGCSACVVACQSENNVPVVGPEQVARGREMHWIRIDRYYEGELENPKVVHQPMLCQHCDHAPCENVCPVNATNHSPDGLNQMAYNRCVGTRYCANNCPYKVRRFNFLEYTAYKTEPEILVNNPEVTVRPRGVMEKCSFCVQRINDVKIRAKGEGRSVRDGEVTTACMAGCPSDAIVFGDLRDPNSRISQLASASRAYRVLEEIGARPAITYLADLKNPAAEATLGGSHAH
ncbi:TAT-variant-translocated molybdopterin oxidoreductase [Geothrix sp. 21YS21S-4]|uniref:TAT-variant-translocated molybdopterin oxidoreductase n=1 Tax=Geothrix sp. 21YS21S-4 TaxID=3068889 RepID=UPI0027B947CE|nr:TAT-variant-translocated molybdopterin oxidoreductase [Geothrix sp. 21YS21S-4]